MTTNGLPRVMEVQSKSGPSIFIQIRETTLEHHTTSSSQDSQLDRLPEGTEVVGAEEKLSSAIAGLRVLVDEAATLVTDAVAKHGPTEFKVELNVGFTGKASPIPFLVGTEAEASLKITIGWKKIV